MFSIAEVKNVYNIKAIIMGTSEIKLRTDHDLSVFALKSLKIAGMNFVFIMLFLQCVCQWKRKG